jgi:ornithine carbamoyltransferase
MLRTHAHSDLTGLAEHSTVPVINGLTDYNHPCQVMADMQTIKEKFGKFDGLKMCYLGDGNNMTVSLVNGCMQFGLDIAVVSPKGYMIDGQFRNESLANAKERGTNVVYTNSIEEGATGANIIVTDTWVSMGQEGGEQKLKDFADYQVTDRVMQMADKDAIFMHCLPAHREEEVATSVIDGPQSVIFDEAENRLHAQKAVMYTIMK